MLKLTLDLTERDGPWGQSGSSIGGGGEIIHVWATCSLAGWVSPVWCALQGSHSDSCNSVASWPSCKAISASPEFLPCRGHSAMSLHVFTPSVGETVHQNFASSNPNYHSWRAPPPSQLTIPDHPLWGRHTGILGRRAIYNINSPWKRFCRHYTCPTI